MNQILTKEAAHRLFGELYRRSRPPEIQRQVDQIVKNNKDVFVRIKLIEELEKKNISKDIPLKAKPKNIDKGLSKTSIHKPVKNADLREEGEGLPLVSPKPQAVPGKTASKQKKGPGFFERLFGRESKRITAWGRDSHTLRSNFFQLELSQDSRRIFSGLQENDVIKTIQAFRLAAGGIWEYVDALNYNTLIAAYQFFSEYIKHDNIFFRISEPDQWIEETLAMQKNYAQLLGYTGYRNLLLHTLPDYIASNEKYNSLLPGLKVSMQHIILLTNQKPSLKDTITAFYALAENKLYRWEAIEAKLGVQKPIDKRFCAPQEVQLLIQQRIQNLKKRSKTLGDEMQEIGLIREKYLALKEDGRFDSRFLDHLIYDAVRRAYGEKKATAHVVASHKSQAHRLLFAILRDFNVNYLPLLSTSFSVSGADKVTETINVFSVNIFRERIEAFNQLLRMMDTYLRKYPGLNYSFSDFAANLQKKIFDPSLETFHRIVEQANGFFKHIVLDIQTVLNNHEKAKASSTLEKERLELQKQKSKPIEEIESKACYLPYSRLYIAFFWTFQRQDTALRNRKFSCPYVQLSLYFS